MDSHLNPEEEVHIVLVGSSAQVLVALSDRLLLVKPGHMAGATFGAKVATFPYTEISAIEVNTTMFSGVIEVIAAGYDGRKPTSYWSGDKDKDPFKLSNCLPIAKRNATAWKPHLDWIRQRVAASKHPPPVIAPPSATGSGQEDWVASLERLQALRAAGGLTGDEFEAAKQRLLRESN